MQEHRVVAKLPRTHLMILITPIFSVQYHPAAPGPHDATYLFDSFTEMMEQNRKAG